MATRATNFNLRRANLDRKEAAVKAVDKLMDKILLKLTGFMLKEYNNAAK